jgi:hypothetical protein
MLHSYWTFVCKFRSVEKKPSLQVLDSSNDQDHAEGNVECPGIDASEEAVGDRSNVILCTSHTPHSSTQLLCATFQSSKKVR